MGQFDNVIPVNIKAGKTVSKASMRPPKKYTVVPTSVAANTADWVGDPVQGGDAAPADVSATRASRDIKKATSAKTRTALRGTLSKRRGEMAAGLATTDRRLDPKTGENYSIDPADEDYRAPKPANPKTLLISKGTVPANTSAKPADFPEWTPPSAETVAKGEAGYSAKESESAASTAARRAADTAAYGAGGAGDKTITESEAKIVKEYDARQEAVARGEKYVKKEEETPKSAVNAMPSQVTFWRQGEGAAGLSDAARERRLAGKRSKSGSGMWDSAGREITSTDRKATAPKKKTTTGGVIPIDALNAEWTDEAVSRGPNPGKRGSGGHLLDLNEQSGVNLPGQSPEQLLGKAASDLRRTSTPKSDVGIKQGLITEHARSMAITAFSDKDGKADLDAVKMSSSPKGYHHTKATVMALAGLKPDQEHLLDAHLGSPTQTHAHNNRLNTAYNHLMERQRFEHTSIPGNGTKFSAERGNLDISEGSKDYFVPKGSSQLTHASLLGKKTELEGSTVGFNGYVPSKDEEGKTKYTALEHPNGSKLHQGYHPYSETHPETGEQIRVFRHNDILGMPEKPVHVGDVAETYIKAGQTVGQGYRTSERQRGNVKPRARGTRSGHAAITAGLINEIATGKRPPLAGGPEIGTGEGKKRPITDAEENLRSNVKNAESEGKFIEMPGLSKTDVDQAKSV